MFILGLKLARKNACASLGAQGLTLKALSTFKVYFNPWGAEIIL